jgi:predicted nucleic acid-binding protein
MTLVDTNVILDLLKGDPRWAPWSATQLSKARLAGPIAINAVIYAELSAHPQAQTSLDAFLSDAGFTMPAIDKRAARLAGQAFLEYRRRKGGKTGVLPDFFIGAQAMAEAGP